MSATKLGKAPLNSAEVTPFKVRQAKYEHKVSLSRYTSRGLNMSALGTNSTRQSLRKPIVDNESPHYSYVNLVSTHFTNASNRTDHAAVSASNHVFTAAQEANGRALTKIAPGSALGYPDDEFRDATNTSLFKITSDNVSV